MGSGVLDLEQTCLLCGCCPSPGTSRGRMQYQQYQIKKSHCQHLPASASMDHGWECVKSANILSVRCNMWYRRRSLFLLVEYTGSMICTHVSMMFDVPLSALHYYRLHCTCFAYQVKCMGAVGSKCVHHCTTLYQDVYQVAQFRTHMLRPIQHQKGWGISHPHLSTVQTDGASDWRTRFAKLFLKDNHACMSGIFRSNISYHHNKSECHQSMRT